MHRVNVFEDVGTLSSRNLIQIVSNANALLLLLVAASLPLGVVRAETADGATTQPTTREGVAKYDRFTDETTMTVVLHDKLAFVLQHTGAVRTAPILQAAISAINETAGPLREVIFLIDDSRVRLPAQDSKSIPIHIALLEKLAKAKKIEVAVIYARDRDEFLFTHSDIAQAEALLSYSGFEEFRAKVEKEKAKAQAAKAAEEARAKELEKERQDAVRKLGDVIFLIDGTGSMIEQMYRAQNDLKEKLLRLEPTQKFSVFLFRSDSVQTSTPRSVPATEDAKKKAFDFLERVTAAGDSSNVQAAFEAAAAQHPKTIVLYSDGDLVPEDEDIDVIARVARSAKCHINVFFMNVGGRERGEFQRRMKRLADQTGGEFRVISTPAE